MPAQPFRTVRNCWLKIGSGMIAVIGPEGEPFPIHSPRRECFDARGWLATPGLIECHTHPVFAAWRQGEFVRRTRGESYQQIAAAGGGILSSVRAVRAASEEQLTEAFRRRLDRFLELGVTVLEAKTGYGLSLQDEYKMLRVIRRGSSGHPVEVVPTLLAAHVAPPEYRDHSDRYVDLVCEEIIPLAASEKLAEGVDVFLEEGAFNAAQTRRIFSKARELGLARHLHADQFSDSGGAEIAAEFEALTADHMDRTGVEGRRLLAEAGVTVVLLPGAVFFLGLNQYASGRSFIDSGCRVALSTDFNPGTSPTCSLPLMMTLSCVKMGLTPEEALWGVTAGAAKALARPAAGGMAVGGDADLCLWEAEDIDFLSYRVGDLIPQAVFKRGELVARKGALVDDTPL